MLSPPVLPRIPEPLGILIAGRLGGSLGALVDEWARSQALVVSHVRLPLERRALRAATPALVLLGVDEGDDAGYQQFRDAILALKTDGRLQTVPTVIATADGDVAAWLNAGADDVITDRLSATEQVARLTAALRRARRDIQVNPSTRLAGADALAAAMLARIQHGELFGACYADLDHFKEFNDRYGYAMGDDVIRTVAELLVEVVEAAAGERGFVGHIGGDDFLFLVPLECVPAACDLLVQRADEILPCRYSAHDRQAGYFFGKDRRGRLDRVPLMTLSIGVVTNERRRFSSAAQVSELATEMKTFAKSLPGSVWAMDRRSDGESATPPEETLQ